MKRIAKAVGLLLCAVAGIIFWSLVHKFIDGDNIVPDRPHRWVGSISLQPDSKVVLVEKTSFLGTSGQRPINGVSKIALGDNIAGVQIGAIKCFHHDRDDYYGGEQFMWRGRWGCQAGRTKAELDNSVQNDGTKNFNYIHTAPVSISLN